MTDVRASVVVVGSAHVDLIAVARRLPRRGETLGGHAFAIHPGGKALNQAVAVARQGTRAVLVARTGDDDFGRLVRDTLVEGGVDVTRVGVDADVGTGASTVLVGEDGDYASVVVPGAGARLGTADVEAAVAAEATARVVLVQLELGVDLAVAALEEGRRFGCTTILNAAPAPESAGEIPSCVWDAVDVLIVNRVEASMLLHWQDAGAAGGTAENGMAAALAAAFGPRTVVVTLGAAGAAVWDAERTIVIPAHAVTPVDTIGAGDAFCGAFAAAIARGASVSATAERANAAGALAVTRRGGAAGMPTAVEVDALVGAVPAVVSSQYAVVSSVSARARGSSECDCLGPRLTTDY